MMAQRPKAHATQTALLGDGQVVAAGTYVVQRNQPLLIFPFEDDFAMSINIDVGKLTPNIYPTYRPDDIKGCYINIEMPYKNSFDKISNQRPIYFAVSDDGQIGFYLNIFVLLLGQPDTYTALVNYTIFEGEILPDG